MKNCEIATSLYSVMAMCSVLLAGGTSVGGHRIVASCEGAAFALTQPIRVGIQYSNETEDPWTLYQPDQSAGVGIRAVSDNQYHGRVSRSMGKVRVVESEGITHWFADVPPELTIEPGERFTFEVDLNSPFRGNFQPGHWTMSVNDRVQKLSAEPVRFAIVITRDTVDHCITYVNDESNYRVNRRLHGEVLTKVRPDIEIHLRGLDRTREEQAEVDEHNREAIAEFNTWWAEERDSEEVEEALERINEEAGVLEEYRALRDELAAAAEEEPEGRTRDN